MKIGLVCPYNIVRGGGVQEGVRSLQLTLSQRGHEVLILTPQPRDFNQEAPAGVVFLGLAADIKSPFHTTGQISVSLNNEAVEAVLSREAFDILHFHEPWVPIVSRQILSRSQSINIATFHATLPGGVMTRTLERVITPYTKSIIKYLDGLTAVSETAAAYIRSLTKKPVAIIPNGIDLEKYRLKPTARSQSPTILFIGRLERRKGLIYLLKAFEYLSATHPSAQLVIAGDGPDRAKLEEWVQDQGLKRVHFKGYVSESEKLKLLAQADLFCSPALYGESFGIVLLEAMAAGVPVVAGNNSGYQTVMTGLGQLSLVSPKDTIEFARRLSLLLDQEDLRRLWRQWATQRVQEFAYPRVVDQYEALYQNLMKAKP